MTNRELKQLAKNQISGNILILLVIAIIISLINSAAAAVPIVGCVAIFIVGGTLYTSTASIYLNLSKGHKPEIDDLQIGMKQWKESSLLFFLITLYLTLWSLLFIIPAIIKCLSYSQAYYILADNPGMTASEALTESRRIMDGHKWEFFVLNLSFIGWHLLALCTLGLLYIYITPYMNATFATYYNNIKGRVDTTYTAV